MMDPIEWEKFYSDTETEKMPWYYPELDPDLEAVLGKMKISSGRVLDIGTGPGTQAMALAELGFEVTATDISAEAIRLCSEKARIRGLSIKFQADDILHSKVAPGLDVIFDRGCFHALEPSKRESYREIIASLIAPRGLFFLKCFNIKETMEGGPYRFSPGEIRKIFSPRFSILSIDETVYQGTLTPLPKALFVVMKGLEKKT